MANSATARTGLNIQVGKRRPVIPVTVVIDTTGADLTVFTPDADKMAGVCGIIHSDGTAANLTIKSGSTTYCIPELAANQGVIQPIGNHLIFVGQPGEAVVFNSSAAITSMLVYCVQAENFDFSG